LSCLLCSLLLRSLLLFRSWSAWGWRLWIHARILLRGSIAIILIFELLVRTLIVLGIGIHADAFRRRHIRCRRHGSSGRRRWGWWGGGWRVLGSCEQRQHDRNGKCQVTLHSRNLLSLLTLYCSPR